MNRLKELIDKLCPTGVKFIQLSDVVTVKRGVRVVKKQLSPVGKYPVFQNCLTPMGYYDQFNVSANTAFIICAGAAGEIGYSAIEFWAADDCFYFVCSNDIDSRYLYHFLLTQKTYLYSKIRKASIPRLSHKFIEIIKIPVPPLEVQREIVRILDNFTSLTAELQAELQARKKQYEYYRDSLLSKYESVSMKSIESLCKVSAGGDAPKDAMSKSKTVEYKFPIISNGVGENALYGYTNQAKIMEPAVTVAARGTIGYAEYRDYPYFPIIRLLSLIPNDTEELDTKFLYYCLQGKKYNVPTTGIPQLTAPMLKQVEIPLPNISVQRKIVGVLDNFEQICNDLNIGLPAEIEARQKQYEYYRDALLSFDNSYFVNVERERERER